MLNELREALESNGFTAAEAERIIIPVSQGLLPLSVQPKTVQFEPGQEIDAEVAQVQVAALDGKVRIDAAKGEITVLVPLDEDETEKLVSGLARPAHRPPGYPGRGIRRLLPVLQSPSAPFPTDRATRSPLDASARRY